jgi:murein DD-endopeptidase MepM/ murein hydrolase activator NlpD
MISGRDLTVFRKTTAIAITAWALCSCAHTSSDDSGNSAAVPFVIEATIDRDQTHHLRVYPVPGRERLFAPDLADDRWRSVYKTLNRLLKEPLPDLASPDVNPLFGYFSFRVHPHTLIPRYHHNGIDIFRRRGTDVRVVFPGVAERFSDNLGGNWIRVAHEITTTDGYQLFSHYLHLDEIAAGVVDGEIVHAGEVVGRLGATGIMQGFTPHVHLELRLKSRDTEEACALDPSLIFFQETVEAAFWESPQEATRSYRNLTSELEGGSVPEELADLINALPQSERRFLDLYVERWQHLAHAGSLDHRILLKKLDRQVLVSEQLKVEALDLRVNEGRPARHDPR